MVSSNSDEAEEKQSEPAAHASWQGDARGSCRFEQALVMEQNPISRGVERVQLLVFKDGNSSTAFLALRSMFTERSII